MRCRGCGKEFGTEVFPELVSTTHLTKRIQIIGTHGKHLLGYDWELDYDTEKSYESEIMDHAYECSFCWGTLREEEVARYVEETK